MTIVANLIYNLCTKVTAQVHPLAALAVTYAVALGTCLVLYPLMNSGTPLFVELRGLNWSSAILGMAIVLLETGFILAFRSGWNLSQVALYSNVAVTLILLPVSYFIFHDAFTWTKAVGMAIALTGLILMSR